MTTPPPSGLARLFPGVPAAALFLMIAQAAMQLSWAVWWVLLNNFAVEVVQTTGSQYGLQQSIREIPGLLTVTVVLWLLVMREQTLALVALALQGIGIAVTGYFTTLTGFFLTTIVLSFGFHYYEAMQQSLALQWLDQRETPIWLGRIVAVGACAQLAAYALVFIGFRTFAVGYADGVRGGRRAHIRGDAVPRTWFPAFPAGRKAAPQVVLRRRYWLYYALTFMHGARRQIFTVFASFMMVAVFKFAVHEVALLFLVNCVFNILFAPKLGALIARLGERWALTVENVLLLFVFVGYAIVQNAWIAAFLYIVDGASMTLGIAIRTYLQKIGDVADMASTAGVGSSVNHIAAVFIPAGLGLVWVVRPDLVFYIGAGFALVSLAFARLIPLVPAPGNETALARPAPQPAE